MIRVRAVLPLLLALLGFGFFSISSQWRAPAPTGGAPTISDRVVIAAPVLLVLFAGDNYLAANLETIRLAITGVDRGQVDTGYLMRAQYVVAQLNACHEDNYYLANGLLTWGGSDMEATEILRQAMNCRFWDATPAFFYGFNRSFFQKDIAEAGRALELAAQRSPAHAAPFRNLAIMLQSEHFADEKLALNYLVQQRDAARADPKLQQMLDKRVVRLQGLVALREAQQRFEAKYGSLQRLEQLLERGVLASLPEDPLRLGYELRDGRVILKKLKIAGMEEQP